ncbi:hypothetical protein [Mycobacterium sp. UM_CSW]|uniref:hypothetical protein n=1 Tax=Mycobacterium sp. UM_CSW TaxID=1370119 RepID=UPI0012687E1A|nr:hypothetical protein [Mycobacterium sp. UM_CSW]
MGYLPYDCTGVWRQPDGDVRTVTIRGVDGNQRGWHKTVDVHVRGDQAYTNSVWEGWGNILAGLGALVLGVVMLLPSRPSRASRFT